MAKLKLVSSQLKSRSIRSKKIGNSGVRKFKGNGIQTIGQEGGNAITRFFSSINRFGRSFLDNNVTNFLKGVSITLSKVWGGLVQATTFLWNFNWNITDEELTAQVKSSFNALGSDFGRLAGFTAGYLACGALPGAVLAYFNKALATEVLTAVGEAALDRLIGELSSLLTAVSNYLLTASMSFIYKNARNLIRGTDDEFLDKLFDKKAPLADIKKQVAQRDKPFIISEKVENRINSIKNEFFKNAASAFLEELGESCIEAGFVVTGVADEYFARQKLSRNPLLGTERTIEVSFNDNDEPVFKKQTKTVDYINDRRTNQV